MYEIRPEGRSRFLAHVFERFRNDGPKLKVLQNAPLRDQRRPFHASFAPFLNILLAFSNDNFKKSRL